MHRLPRCTRITLISKHCTYLTTEWDGSDAAGEMLTLLDNLLCTKDAKDKGHGILTEVLKDPKTNNAFNEIAFIGTAAACGHFVFLVLEKTGCDMGD